MNELTVRINRIKSPSGRLYSRRVVIGGKPSAMMKNGGNCIERVRREDVIFVQIDGDIKSNALLFPGKESELAIDFRLIGNFYSGYCTFFSDPVSGGPLPSLSFDRLMKGIENGTLSETERRLALLIFTMEAFDLEELLRSKHSPELVSALKGIGAVHYAAKLNGIIDEQLRGYALPVTGGENDEALKERFCEAETVMLNADTNSALTDELQRAAASYIGAHFAELFTDEDFVFGCPASPEPMKTAVKADLKKLMRKKHFVKKLLIYAAILLAFWGALFLFWKTSAAYPSRAALESNSRAVTITAPRISLREYTTRSRRLHIASADEEYFFCWSNTPRIGMSIDELAEALEKESALMLVVQGEDTVCAISGENTEYLSVEAYNAYQRTQSTIGTVLILVFALFGLFLFLVALLITAALA